MPGQPVGPSLFPTVIGIGLVVFGTALARNGLRAARTQRAFELDDWVRRPAMVRNFALVISALLFYSLAVDALGFFITAFVILSTLFLALGVRRRLIAPVAIAVTLVIHYGFYTLLRVPLPWGVLESIAW